eukprot:CAMPEP_0202882474 /NCGR_PEP_ID=MMETSP1391-20130828/38051_1 /ASSEMBLY_ACC=CAM_ASM_000867 /TAXON_ID=1034604 /ORGANISM="Chlamydomonas leiostraca, Strain SAG 11-49" /LENGTH=141 /DNA_ID=CAMNT_0049565337 /DNA_START=40 /DNA_END=465 /DNA_ORIENTATION=+
MTSGWTTFALKTMTVSFGAATVVGLTAQMAFAAVAGPVVPFLVASTMGFAGGMYHRWHFDSREALQALQEFPEVMGHHVYLLGPASFKDINIEEWKADAHKSMWKKSMLVVAMYGASDVLARIRQEREEQLFRQYTSQFQE